MSSAASNLVNKVWNYCNLLPRIRAVDENPERRLGL